MKSHPNVTVKFTPEVLCNMIEDYIFDKFCKVGADVNRRHNGTTVVLNGENVIFFNPYKLTLLHKKYFDNKILNVSNYKSAIDEVLVNFMVSFNNILKRNKRHKLLFGVSIITKFKVALDLYNNEFSTNYIISGNENKYTIRITDKPVLMSFMIRPHRWEDDTKTMLNSLTYLLKAAELKKKIKSIKFF